MKWARFVVDEFSYLGTNEVALIGELVASPRWLLSATSGIETKAGICRIARLMGTPLGFETCSKLAPWAAPAPGGLWVRTSRRTLCIVGYSTRPCRDRSSTNFVRSFPPCCHTTTHCPTGDRCNTASLHVVKVSRRGFRTGCYFDHALCTTGTCQSLPYLVFVRNPVR